MRARNLFAVGFLVAAAATPAFAGPCPAIMIVLDRSGSMADQPDDGSGTGPNKLDIAKSAINAVVDKYGATLPLGLETFESEASCNDGIDIVVEPTHGSGAALKTKLAMIETGGGTNTGQAVAKAAADPLMKDSKRPGSYILLITDGKPTCNGTTQDDPLYTISEIQKAHDAGIDTFVIGFGKLPPDAVANMALMSTAGGHECVGATCNGQKYYAADNAQSLNDALDSITLQITGEFAGTCDDSCYANGCDAGLLCVKGSCQPDPCVNVTTCAPGDYCFTDGVSPGTCVSACSQSCAAGQSCQFGKCAADPCASTSCGDGQVCKNGNCVADNCGAGCASGLICSQGACIDDPCHYVTCPDATTCVVGIGSCASSTEVTGAAATAGGDDASRRVGGCAFGQIDPGAPSLMVILLGGALAIISRRRPRP